MTETRAARQSPVAPVRTVLFDLDGTLADTAPDLAHALNRLLQEEGRPRLPLETICTAASHGSIAMLRLVFDQPADDPEFQRLRQRFLDLYLADIARESTLFAGMEQVLTALETRGLNWGVVTNKPARFTDPLMQALGLAARAACVVSGDTTANSKPHPEPMEHACRLAGSDAAQCLYVGDARRDIEAGQAAGMRTLVAAYGYLSDTDQPDTWGADGMIAAPENLLAWLTENSPAGAGHD